jgi:hypothetical protein
MDSRITALHAIPVALRVRDSVAGWFTIVLCPAIDVLFIRMSRHHGRLAGGEKVMFAPGATCRLIRSNHGDE